MDTHNIDAKAFQKLFLAGANRINEQKEYINELNVFPVPDGDTGTNMSLTILSAAKEVEKKLSIQAGRISDQFSSKLSSSQKNLDSHAKGLFWISLIPTALLVLLEVMRHIFPLT